eukprot:TRINITY_DN1124_c0_g1_i6.p1 TRINITY_DN1124_c0_g1~~TRINITY_DN1124_c0_g1_i6.p1  ORF type:complete len:381 (-),score=100.27 TRINITY_DN1124_c0_g1_i6:4-1146(-)
MLEIRKKEKKFGKLLQEKFSKDSKVGNKKLKEIFYILSNNKEELDLPTFKEYLEEFFSHFKLKLQHIIKKYESKEAALKIYRRPKEELVNSIIDVQNQIKMKGKTISYYQFRKAFLLSLFRFETITPFTLTKSFQFSKMTLKPDDIFKEHLINQKKKNKILVNHENRIENSTVTTLPEQRGLRMRIFMEIFKYLSASETLKMSLVCKEWLSISRSDLVWEGHFKRDLKLNQSRDEEDRVVVDSYVPGFIGYFFYLDHILDDKALDIAPRDRTKRCGIGALPRNDSILFNQISIDSTNNTEISKEMKGCCHDSISLISKEIFSNEKFVSLASFSMEEKEIELWKSTLTNKISLDCMENEMDENEIKTLFYQHIVFKFFKFL